MIKSLADEATADLFSGINSRHARRFPHALWTVIRKRLIALNAATRIEDVAAVGGHRFEYLKGDRAGTCSIRVNEQYRITFEFVKGDAYNVRCEDYHR